MLLALFDCVFTPHTYPTPNYLEFRSLQNFAE
eukprot:UN22672